MCLVGASEILGGFDYGINVVGHSTTERPLRVIKLHGSFTWTDSWPVRRSRRLKSPDPLWIPPGIQKAKERYPFNILWGLAREQLECDILRVVGCRLSASDWDLISLIFSTHHTHGSNKPCLLYTSPSPRDRTRSRMPSSA